MRIALGALSLISVVVLSGCISTRIGSNTQINPLQGASLHGRVHGGENPVVGANVYLYAANTTGYGSASVSLLDSPGYVTTDSNGNFSITGDYTCPSANSQVYLYTVGGNPGLAQGTNNSAAGMLAGLGSCGSLKSSTVAIVNEVSTIATAYAIAGYAVDATHVSSSGSALALTGIANAFAAISNLEQVTTTGGVTSFMGVANATTPAGNGTVPQAEINTLANILAACTNSTGAVTGPTANATPCYTLFTNAESGGATGTQPTDTATAAINIAHNPYPYGAGIIYLYELQTANSPFQPDLSYMPYEFSVGIEYTGGGLNGARGLAVDGLGNVWFANFSGSTVSEFSSLGIPLSPLTGFTGGGLHQPPAIAIDGSGNVWLPNFPDSQGARVSEFNPAGVPLSGSSGYSGGGLQSPQGIAIDKTGDVWVSDAANALIEFNSFGSPLSGASGYTGGGLNSPLGLAVDNGGNIWAANVSGMTLSEFSSMGSPIFVTTAGSGGLNRPESIAVDGSGDIWAISLNNYRLSELNSSGAPISGSSGFGAGFGGIDQGGCLAIDGLGRAWVTDATSSGGISEFGADGTLMSPENPGYLSSFPSGPLWDIAVDGAGNVWVTSWFSSSIFEYVGAAAPVVTPIVANLLPPYGQHAVNEP